jgi:sterol desaturase/sphingolipid hydroxylase (fatty acid hydroxylase superfamily)
VILLISLVIYYWSKITFLFSDFEAFLALFMEASHLNSFNLFFLFKTLTISMLAFVTEMFFLGIRKSTLYKLSKKPSKSLLLDLYCYLLSVTKLFDFLMFILTFGIFYFLISILTNYINLDLARLVPNRYLQFVLVFIFSDFIDYLRHRFNHLKHFWELHAYHHSATEFNLITTSRGSLFEAGFNSIFFSVVYVVVGGSYEPIVAVVILREWYVHVLHSNVKWDLGVFGKYIFISPMDHQLHHSVMKEDYDKNFGLIFVWWDKLFGTYKKNRDANLKIGVPDNYFHQMSFFKGQIHSFNRFLKSLSNTL